MKVYAIFVLSVAMVWAFARYCDDLDRAVAGRPVATVLIPPLTTDEQREIRRIEASQDHEESLESAAEEEGVDDPGASTSANVVCDKRTITTAK